MRVYTMFNPLAVYYFYLDFNLLKYVTVDEATLMFIFTE